MTIDELLERLESPGDLKLKVCEIRDAVMKLADIAEEDAEKLTAEFVNGLVVKIEDLHTYLVKR